jgi:hypothetical protein
MPFESKCKKSCTKGEWQQCESYATESQRSGLVRQRRIRRVDEFTLCPLSVNSTNSRHSARCEWPLSGKCVAASSCTSNGSNVPGVFLHLRTLRKALTAAKGCERPLPPVRRMTAKPALQSSVPSAAKVRREPRVTDAAWRTKVRFGATGEITLEVPALSCRSKCASMLQGRLPNVRHSQFAKWQSAAPFQSGRLE